MATYHFYLFPFTSKVRPNDNMAPPSRAKDGAMALVSPPPAAASGAGEHFGPWTVLLHITYSLQVPMYIPTYHTPPGSS